MRQKYKVFTEQGGILICDSRKNNIPQKEPHSFSDFAQFSAFVGKDIIEVAAEEPEIRLKELFSNFNEPNFTYAECSTCSDRLNLDLYENTKGFLTEYSKSIPSEDMAEIFSFLMTNKSKVNEIIQEDNILKNKVDLIKSGLSKIDKNIL